MGDLLAVKCVSDLLVVECEYLCIAIFSTHSIQFMDFLQLQRKLIFKLNSLKVHNTVCNEYYTVI